MYPPAVAMKMGSIFMATAGGYKNVINREQKENNRQTNRESYYIVNTIGIPM